MAPKYHTAITEYRQQTTQGRVPTGWTKVPNLQRLFGSNNRQAQQSTCTTSSTHPSSTLRRGPNRRGRAIYSASPPDRRYIAQAGSSCPRSKNRRSDSLRRLLESDGSRTPAIHQPAQRRTLTDLCSIYEPTAFQHRTRRVDKQE